MIKSNPEQLERDFEIADQFGYSRGKTKAEILALKGNPAKQSGIKLDGERYERLKKLHERIESLRQTPAWKK